MPRSLERALALLADAEESLRILIQGSLEEEQYGNVARIAEVTESVSRAMVILNTTSSTRPERGATERQSPRKIRQRGPEGDHSSRPPAAAGASGYPRFVRDEDGIVKIGWSKQKGKEYVHRAPRSVIWALAQVLRARRVPGSRFVTAEVLPLADDNGGEAPSYQVYLALSWLRSVGAISGNGRGGYIAHGARISESNLEALWIALPKQD